MDGTYTLADLEQITGANRYVIQEWARQDLLEPIERTKGAGRGVHRRFNKEEVELAALLATLSGYCSLGSLRVFAKKYKARATQQKFEHTDTRILIDASRTGDDRVYLAFTVEDADRGSIDVFRWDEKCLGPPARVAKAKRALLINLARTWSKL